MDWNHYITAQAMIKTAGAVTALNQELSKIPGKKVAFGTMAAYGGYKGYQGLQQRLYEHRQNRLRNLQMKMQQLALKNQMYGATHG